MGDAKPLRIDHKSWDEQNSTNLRQREGQHPNIPDTWRTCSKSVEAASGDAGRC